MTRRRARPLPPVRFAISTRSERAQQIWSADLARAPRQAATAAATCAGDADSAAATAADNRAASAAAATAATAADRAATATAAAAAAALCDLLAEPGRVGGVPVENEERRETDVGKLFLAERDCRRQNGALRAGVRRHDVGRCAPGHRQRHACGAPNGQCDLRTVSLRSLLGACHCRLLYLSAIARWVPQRYQL